MTVAAAEEPQESGSPRAVAARPSVSPRFRRSSRHTQCPRSHSPLTEKLRSLPRGATRDSAGKRIRTRGSRCALVVVPCSSSRC